MLFPMSSGPAANTRTKKKKKKNKQNQDSCLENINMGNKFTPRTKPFDGKQGEAMQWLRKFKGYVGATNMEDGPASHSFYMMLEGSADNWFCSLADNQAKNAMDIIRKTQIQISCFVLKKENRKVTKTCWII